MRKPFQGVWNIMRFNWHFYLIAGASVLFLLFVAEYLPSTLDWLLFGLVILVAVGTIVSLAVSFYVYDVSGFYELNWLERLKIQPKDVLVNIHAGFDETSELLAAKFPGAQLAVFDFYDPLIHTEVSIKRARRAYPSFRGTQSISSASIPLKDKSAGNVFLIFAAHEIRLRNERIQFLREAKRVLQSHGQIIVAEHLRDTANFLAYNFGFFHFHSKKEWLNNFHAAGLKLKTEIKITPFISAFLLEPYGNAS